MLINCSENLMATMSWQWPPRIPKLYCSSPMLLTFEKSDWMSSKLVQLLFLATDAHSWRAVFVSGCAWMNSINGCSVKIRMVQI